MREGPSRAHGPEHPSPLQNPEGKVAFITGGSSGIGLGIAQACVEAGMKVVIGYQTQAHADEALDRLSHSGDRVHSIKVNVTNRAEMASAAAQVMKLHGKLHLLVNNAGVSERVAISDATNDDWEWIMETNLTGTLNGIREFLPNIRSHREGGQVVCVSSIWGFIGSHEWGVYSVSKAAVIALAEVLRGELYRENVGVSVYCPGAVNSRLGNSRRNRPERLAHAAFQPDEELLRTMQDYSTFASGLGMDPLEAGRHVLQGIRRNDLYILSHPEYEEGLRDKCVALLGSVPTDVVPPVARINVEQPTLRSQVFIRERARKRSPP